eukprot:TRINITY_DN10974_c0_g1_i4.p1 TRINITY_DN10974_c0_g1~~TRINITY_DN10974_c0_g1_i4.p1  ORF type:complete len:153 (-),score=9.70 TRINITY_DN10974_c0_g1_i4:90-548(-)
MGRSLLFAVTSINGKQVAVGTTHLESLNSSQRRAEQLKFALSNLAPFDEAILMGDFNLESSENIIPDSYYDLWPSLHDISKAPGYTMPAQQGFAAWRPDRIILKKSQGSQPKSIKIIGNDPISSYSEEILRNDWLVKTPSDHYCLVGEIALS